MYVYIDLYTHLYELNMRTEFFSQILYLLQALWFKAIKFSFIHNKAMQTLSYLNDIAKTIVFKGVS